MNSSGTDDYVWSIAISTNNMAIRDSHDLFDATCFAMFQGASDGREEGWVGDILLYSDWYEVQKI